MSKQAEAPKVPPKPETCRDCGRAVFWYHEAQNAWVCKHCGEVHG